jgi:pimeloyl-ACP methyl ester carboxylesterase
LQRDVVFTHYSPLTRSDELRRRLLSPLNALRASRKLAQSGRVLRDQTIDMAQERFAVYVPDAPAPAGGYALLVFVSPWPQAVVPQRSIPALNRHHMIFVSAAHSGNDADVMDRRIPLALLAEWNVTQRYRVDPSRVYIGGFSGGSRVALRIALDFPDVFHGALLDAGSDPIGNAQIPLPARELFQRFQNSTRLVYLTGKQDDANLAQDVRSRQSMRDWCVFNLDDAGSGMLHTGHQLAGPAAIEHALTVLDKPLPPFSAAHAGCRRDLDRSLAAKERQIGDLVATARFDDAQALLNKVDMRFGGLAAAPTIKWQKALDARSP